MLNRRKNLSHKQRREQMMLKRAVKRGDISPPPPLKPDRRVRKPRNPTVPVPEHAIHARRLQSSFIKLPPQFLKKTEILASAVTLTRPVPPEVAILSDVNQEPPSSTEGESSRLAQLTCPRRPKWRYDMSKKEIEANEEGLFQKWLAQTDASVNAWCSAEEPPKPETQPNAEDPPLNNEPEEMPHAPTTFERNLEVYRQLWRVTEISQILLILLDSRCPTLHFPPALLTYLSSVSNAARLRTILVLTKVDISGPERADAWTRTLQERYPGVRVVQVESFVEKHPDAHGSTSNAAQRRAHKPFLPSKFRTALVDALRATHAELLEPPEEVKANPERLAKWKPKVKTHVDWDAALKAHGGDVGTAVASKPQKATADGRTDGEQTTEEGHLDRDHPDEDAEPDILTIGVIGQPNVGKSSLLNALFGATKVKASHTPGKTKHFQTLFWTSELRLVDCPGLVFPNYVHMETQVLSGILPISRVSAIPLCIHHAAQLLPLEHILGLTHPSLAEEPEPAVALDDKRTWREGMHPRARQGKDARAQTLKWTANDILTAYAEQKGWITARVGRPDVKRAGNASECPLHLIFVCLLRALAEGRIRWAFWPPGTDVETIRAHQHVEGAGIWVAEGPQHVVDLDDEHHPHEDHSGDDDDDGGGDSEEGEDHSHREDDHVDEEDEDEDEEEGEGEEEGQGDDDGAGSGATTEGRGRVSGARKRLSGTTGRFGALILEDEGEEDDASSDADEKA
ncbi:hypothetical protein C8Q77DRAFT_1224741 [Trametes polyzona]|nr:hypothetical protein C8Q77DRAFT_1224741 [Trametes polyzona]